jgi:hypothetical protein
MANRSVHYEAAFEEYLRQRRLPYVAVDEAKRSLVAAGSLKSFDFVVYPGSSANLLVDVKGRSLRDPAKHRGFECWVTQADVNDLLRWATLFGPDFSPLLCFAYHVPAPLFPGLTSADTFAHANSGYLFMGIDLREYQQHMRIRSPRWQTVCLSAEDFRSLARPFADWV